jgi:hypothetical protein
MKEYRYKLTCTGTVTGLNKEEAKKALMDWLNVYCSDFKVSHFEEIGDAW